MLNPKNSPVKRACLHCHNDHKKCDTNRPCSRCVARGVACVEQGGKRKRRDFEESLEERAAKKGVMMVSFRFAGSSDEKIKSQKVSPNQTQNFTQQEYLPEFTQEFEGVFQNTKSGNRSVNQDSQLKNTGTSQGEISENVQHIRNNEAETNDNRGTYKTMISNNDRIRNEQEYQKEYHNPNEIPYNYVTSGHITNTSDINSRYQEINQNRDVYAFQQPSNVISQGQLYQTTYPNYVNTNFFPNGNQYELIYPNSTTFDGRIQDPQRINTLPNVADVSQDLRVTRRPISLDSTGMNLYANRDFNYANQNLLNTMDHLNSMEHYNPQQYSNINNNYFQNALSDTDSKLRKTLGDGMEYGIGSNANTNIQSTGMTSNIQQSIPPSISQSISPNIQSFMTTNLGTGFNPNLNPTFNSNLGPSLGTNLNPNFNASLGHGLNPSNNQALSSQLNNHLNMQLNSGQGNFNEMSFWDGQLNPFFVSQRQGVITDLPISDPELLNTFNDPNIGVIILNKKLFSLLYQQPEIVSQSLIVNSSYAQLIHIPYERLLDSNYSVRNIGLYGWCKALKDSPKVQANHKLLLDGNIKLLETKFPLQISGGTYISTLCRLHINDNNLVWMSFEKIDKLDDEVVIDGKIVKARKVFNSPEEMILYYKTNPPDLDSFINSE